MVLSSVYIMDLKGKIIVSRNYRGDIPPAAADKCVERGRAPPGAGHRPHPRRPRPRFSQKIMESDESDLKPIFTDDGITYVYVKVRAGAAQPGVWTLRAPPSHWLRARAARRPSRRSTTTCTSCR